MRPCWADLPCDLLRVIAEKVTTNTQYVHLRAVCKAWRNALTPHPHHLPPQFPWLMLSPQPGISDAHVSFYDIARSKTYQFQFPYMSGKYCCGSSHGWLVLEHEHRVSLLNPITSRCIDLPSLDAPPTLLIPSDYHKGHKSCIQKASLSCNPFKPGCVVVALFSSHTSNWELVFCQIGDSHWTELKKWNPLLRVENFTLYNNLVYTVNTEMEISVYDLQDRSVWTFPSKLSSHLCVRDKINIVGDAGSSGPLIVRMIKYFSDPMVYVYKWSDDWQTWLEVKDIGKRVLFLNERHSNSIILQCDEKQENKVYYDIKQMSDPTWNFFHVGLNRVNLESGMVVPLSWRLVFPLGSPRSGLPLWVTPSLI
ncbi:F-box protein [Carex littledalei]|uniref:F-box protein n=1 Tax=Carex littledalei TaxID=544730 RepID=A0A833RZ98_9POAL|nr:F-box protein [Carex littledalei]